MLTAPVPTGISLSEEARLCVETDILPDGSFGKGWLVVTATHLRVYLQEGDTARLCHDYPLAEISEPKAVNYVGGGAVLVTRADVSVELIRYTNARAPEFASAAGLLEKWLKGEDAPLPENEAKHCPRCHFPLAEGSKICPACLPRSKALRRLLAYLYPHRFSALSLSLVAITGTAIALIPPYLQKPLFDEVLNPHGHASPMRQRLHMLALLVIALVAVHFVRCLLNIAQGWISASLGNRVTHDIRCQLYQHLQYLSLNFFEKRQMGGVISRVNQDTGQLQAFLVWASQDLANNTLLLVGIGTMLFLLNWQLALVVLVPAPFVAIFAGNFWRRIRGLMHRFFRRWGRLNALLSESLNGMRVVKAFAQEPREVERFNKQSLELANAGMFAERIGTMLFSSIGFMIMGGSMLIWYVGGRDVLFGRMSMGELLAFTAYVGMFYAPLQSLSFLFNFSSRSLTAAERVFEVLDSQSDVREDADAVSIPHINGEVEFRNVEFGYERHRLALKKVSFKVAAGEMIGLVGQSGAGKSTTINLLCRFYDTISGDILVDGVPIRKLRLEDLRKQIGLVPQDTFLFSGTIAENIAYAKPDATRAEIIRAAKVANAHDFIRSKPDGYETNIGEGGKGLSGGEMQRLAIARAVLHNPRILILDEATSHVDVETEKQVQEAIGRLVKGRTTFAIAHRLSTLKNADRLLVLKQGEVAEIGSHDELMAKEDGEFSNLVKTYQEISKVHEVAR